MQLREDLSPDIKWDISVKKVLYSGRSKFQAVELIESGPFGKASQLRLKPRCCRPAQALSLQVLLLDGKSQSAEADEHVYHECLVHPALLLHPDPKRVFVCGGEDCSLLSLAACPANLLMRPRTSQEGRVQQ